MDTKAESGGCRNIEKAKEAEEIASKVLYKFVLKSFEEFIETTKSINDCTIRDQHRKGRPAFTNRTKKDFQDPFQICKCYMPYGNSKLNSIDEADFYVLITVIYNFQKVNKRLSKSQFEKVRKHAKLIHDYGQETSSVFVLTDEGLLDYFDQLVQLIVALKDVDQDDESSDAKKNLEKMRRSLESPAFSIKDEKELSEGRTFGDSSIGGTSEAGYKDEWSVCIEELDETKAKLLLENGQIPDALQLQRACETFGLKSDIFKDICIKIEHTITAVSGHINYTEACYRETDNGKIVFVVYTTGPVDDKDSVVERYSVLYRRFDYCSQEGNDVIDREMQEDIQFDDSETKDIEKILKKHSPELMKRHSNLTRTTASNFKSKYTCPEQKACIVFNVTCKGLIPVGEDLLPPRLGPYDTDVREGRFGFNVGGPPGEKHNNIKIGCRISCKNGSGTIGGFIQHPVHGVCAITCAHVVLSTEDILSFRKGNASSSLERTCFQPNYKEEEEDLCGNVVHVRFEEGDETQTGMDVALVKIDDDRVPITGDFPDLDRNKYMKGSCSHCKDDLLKTKLSFKSGMVLDSDEIPLKTFVVKYGQKSRLTSGCLKMKGGSVKFDIRPDMNEEPGMKSSEMKRYQFTLHGLFEINGIGSRFAKPGDSGSLVFSRDENNKLSAVGILVGGDSKSTFVQPICSLLEKIGMERPFNMMNLDPRDQRIEALAINVDKILNKLGIT